MCNKKRESSATHRRHFLVSDVGPVSSCDLWFSIAHNIATIDSVIVTESLNGPIYLL